MEQILKQTIKIAIDAGNKIMEYYEGSIAYSEKEDESPLTDADLESNSIIKKGTSINFIITDLKEEIVVSYEGILPNLFSEGKGVVAEGKLRDPKYFVADTILAKHDENYMPPEVSDALKKSND